MNPEGGAETLALLADENLIAHFVSRVRYAAPAVGIVTVCEAGLGGIKDDASRTNRILLPHDVCTMPGHFAQLLEAGRHSPGVILISKRLPIGDAMEGLLVIWSASTADQWRDQCQHWR